MPVKPDGKGGFLLRIHQKGIPRKTKTFNSRSDAEYYEREFVAKFKKEEELIKLRDDRTLKELVESWFIYHGINLSDGERRKIKLMYMCAELGNPLACELTPEQFVQYRYKKTSTNVNRITPKTFNNMHGYLNAVYHKLRKLKVIDYECPIDEIDFIKVQQRQLSYLNRAQIDTLMQSIIEGCVNKSTWYVAQICVRTGARWGEAENLTRKQLHDGKITFEFTKSKKTRTVPLDSSFYYQLSSYAGNRTPDQRLFDNCISAFRRAVDRTDLELPKGQMTHILRHTFASHFIMNGGNILTLQRILGHSDITMTMRYAHLSPDHLMDAVAYNPLADE